MCLLCISESSLCKFFNYPYLFILHASVGRSCTLHTRRGTLVGVRRQGEGWADSLATQWVPKSKLSSPRLAASVFPHWANPTAREYGFLKGFIYVMYVSTMSLSSDTPQDSIRSLYRWLWATMWLLGIELRTSGKAVSSLNRWAISPARFLPSNVREHASMLALRSPHPTKELASLYSSVVYLYHKIWRYLRQTNKEGRCRGELWVVPKPKWVDPELNE